MGESPAPGVGSPGSNIAQILLTLAGAGINQNRGALGYPMLVAADMLRGRNEQARDAAANSALLQMLTPIAESRQLPASPRPLALAPDAPAEAATVDRSFI